MAAIKDIAKLAGCATSTVSRVLNNRDGVAATTREKVLAAITQLDYKPSLTARGLRVKTDRLIGLAVPLSSAGAFSQIIQLALDCTYKHGYHLLLVNTHEDPELEESFISDLLRRNISGIVLSRVSDHSRILKKFVQNNIPIVVIDRALAHESVSNVVLNNRQAGYIAGRHFLELGHRRLACITGPMTITLCRDRLAGFQQALAEAGIELERSRVYEGDFKQESGVEGVRELCRRGCDFTGIWAMNDWMAFGVLRELQSMGVKVPGDVSLVGMDDTEIAVAANPQLTTVHYPFDELVEKAFELLIDQIGRRKIRTETIVIEPELAVRLSTAPVAREDGNG